MALVGVILAFSSLIYLSIRGVRLSFVMFIATAIMALTSGIPAKEVLLVFWRAFSERTTLELAAAVFSIGVFSTFMKCSGLLDKAVEGLTAFLGNVKAAIMAVPALVGTMPVLGGAALSAPLVDKLGEPLGLTPDTKAAANLVFRHGMFFVFPFSTSLILTSKLTGFTVPQLIVRMWPMSLVLWGVGYLTHLRKTPKSPGKVAKSRAASEAAATAESEPAVETPSEHTEPVNQPLSRWGGLLGFLYGGAPLLLALALGLALSLPLWMALLIGTGAAVLIALRDKRSLPTLRELVEGSNLEQAVAMFWIMAFKSFVELTPVFRDLVDKATSKGVSPALLAFLVPLAFGYANASQTATISVLIPIFVPAAGSPALRMGYTALIYGSSFTAYFFSPLHLCQVLTCQYYGVGMPRVCKRNWPVFAGFMVILTLYYLSVAAI